MNPRRRRRALARRHHNPRRRRHRNPFGGGGLGINDFVKGATGVGLGAVGAKLVSNAVTNTLVKQAATNPIMKVAVTAGVGIVGSFVVGKLLKQRALATGLAVGAGVVVVLDLFDMYLAPHLPATLKDYGYGALNGWAPQGMSAYQAGQLNGWMPQGNAGMSGGGIYEGTIYG